MLKSDWKKQNKVDDKGDPKQGRKLAWKRTKHTQISIRKLRVVVVSIVVQHKSFSYSILDSSRRGYVGSLLTSDGQTNNNNKRLAL